MVLHCFKLPRVFPLKTVFGNILPSSVFCNFLPVVKFFAMFFLSFDTDPSPPSGSVLSLLVWNCPGAFLFGRRFLFHSSICATYFSLLFPSLKSAALFFICSIRCISAFGLLTSMFPFFFLLFFAQITLTLGLGVQNQVLFPTFF